MADAIFHVAITSALHDFTFALIMITRTGYVFSSIPLKSFVFVHGMFPFKFARQLPTEAIFHMAIRSALQDFNFALVMLAWTFNDFLSVRFESLIFVHGMFPFFFTVHTFTSFHMLSDI